MAVTKSARKSIRKNIRQKEKNLVYKNKMKDLVKKVRILISQNKTKEAKSLLPQVYKILDKAAKAKVKKKNLAARKKSRITKALNLSNK